MVDEFWLVWRDGGGAPTYKHGEEGRARGEAERLARESPGDIFHVLRCIDSCRKKDIAWASDSIDRDVPF